MPTQLETNLLVLEKITSSFKDEYQQVVKTILRPKKRGEGFIIDEDGIKALREKFYKITDYGKLKKDDPEMEKVAFILNVAEWTKTKMRGSWISPAGLVDTPVHYISQERRKESMFLAEMLAKLMKNQEGLVEKILEACKVQKK